MYTLILCIIFIGVVVNSKDIITKKYLRGIPQKNMDRTFKNQINEIVTTVLAVASQKNIISFTREVCNIHLDYSGQTSYDNDGEIGLGINADYIIINKLQDILVDSNITMSKPQFCCICENRWAGVCSYQYNANNDLIIKQQNTLRNANCRKLTIQW
jgi:hypothetical protein